MKYDLATKVENQEISDYKNLKEIISKNAEKSLNITVKRAINCDVQTSQNCTFEEKTIKITPSNE
jgi:hypothetical protein